MPAIENPWTRLRLLQHSDKVPVSKVVIVVILALTVPIANFDFPLANAQNPTTQVPNDSNNAPLVTQTVDGELDPVTFTFAREIELTLRDADRNLDPSGIDQIHGRVAVSVDATGGDIEFPDMKETDVNTGVFVVDMANNELPVTFLSYGEEPTPDNTVFELRKSDIVTDVVFEYYDPSDSEGEETVTSTSIKKITLTTGSVHIPDTAAPTANVQITLNDVDLNDRANVKESYVLVLQADIFNMTRFGEDIGMLAYMKIELNGTPFHFGSDILTILLTETGVNTGSFKGSLDMADIFANGNDGNPVSVNEGDQFKIIYADWMSATAVEKTDIMIITSGSPSSNSCQGLSATIVGTGGNDVINGTSGVDVIVGLGGDDTIYGLGGSDIICGNDGKDKLVGGPGNDTLSGDAGNDSLNGGGGKDKLIGGIGNDTLRGGGGDDNLSGGDGDDKLYGQAGIDVLDGGAGSNVLVQD